MVAQAKVPASPPRRSTALRQQFAIANSTTDSGLLLFPKNLLLYKIFSGALIILGALGAYFTRPSPPTYKRPKGVFSCVGGDGEYLNNELSL